ncbi:hypothetical protein HMPREF0454_00865 [Hafnia alvei ATCC 51873]|uniref:Uncharacterized protein n=1 Tax=Hafnia alvei ATCC 51873 TaxID=1002364 RepID=G9Y2U3_HAFAL|nr:hypothetical protein HMPREF0454_00865 [Hafnia alvei ATCC 51873]
MSATIDRLNFQTLFLLNVKTGRQGDDVDDGEYNTKMPPFSSLLRGLVGA